MADDANKKKAAKPAKPAKAAEGGIRFICARCGAKLTAPAKLAGKFLDCPKCKNKTPVPGTQKEADDDARNYTVQEHFYEIPEKCVKCGKKMAKGSVVCTHCGFNYKAGKQLVTNDLTVKADEKLRGGPALTGMVIDVLVVIGAVAALVIRGFVGETLGWFEGKYWWELGLYIGLAAFCLSILPGHFMQYMNFRDMPIRDHPMIKEENYAEKEEAANPLGRWTVIAFILLMLAGVGTGLLIWSRDSTGALKMPWSS